jgi:CRISPR/Cas system CMR-associated protein Cmr3 (group 5 of RAMP superfamily)
MNPINTILLQPTDVLFFRDGRPMEGSLAGHGAAWPLPNVTDAAFHAALHRSRLKGHAHDQRRHADREGKDNRQFGSLVTAGPFPVHRQRGSETWYFPRPLDLLDDTLTPALLPTATFDSVLSSLPDPLEYAVANRLPPTKDTKARAWLGADAFRRYLAGGDAKLNQDEACDDSAFSDQEATVGIAIDAATGTTGQGEAAGKIYSARYLRLRDEWRLGVFARTDEKNGTAERHDLLPDLINGQRQLLVGGQQRLCTAELIPAGTPLPLPRGQTDGFICHEENGRKRWLVKWILLSPAIWPEIPAQSKDGRPMTPHCGGWLPNWVRQSDGQVMLRAGERQRRSYTGKHSRGFGADSQEIPAHLVAALVPKPIPVTGWALANDTDREEGGAKSTHLAVAAGAVYYFEAGSAEDAANLATALNWHGSDPAPATIKNRRSTLMGEKGFGLGVCGTWSFRPGITTAAP